jgi:protein disulfide-isomerase/protein disulfide isomerase family A protein 5
MAAASKLKELGISGKLVAVDAQKENSLGSRFGIRGYPSLKYFKNGEVAFDVSLREEGPIVNFMKDPKEPPPPPPPETPWSEEPSDVVHLNDENFKPILKKTKHVLVMFYAPCKHSVTFYVSRLIEFLFLHFC